MQFVDALKVKNVLEQRIIADLLRHGPFHYGSFAKTNIIWCLMSHLVSEYGAYQLLLDYYNDKI